MLLFIALSNLVCLLLPALIAARVTPWEDPVNLAAHHVKRLSTPLKNLLHRRDAVLVANTPNAPDSFALNSTNGDNQGTMLFEKEIDIPGLGRLIYFNVKGEIDHELSVTVEFWAHYDFDRRIGVFHGYLVQGVDMKMIPGKLKVIDGEARLFVVRSGEYNILIFEAYGSVHISNGPGRTFPLFLKQLKRWRAGDLSSIEDVPNNSGVQTLSNNVHAIAVSNNAGVDKSFSLE